MALYVVVMMEAKIVFPAAIALVRLALVELFQIVKSLFIAWPRRAELKQSTKMCQ